MKRTSSSTSLTSDSKTARITPETPSDLLPTVLWNISERPRTDRRCVLPVLPQAQIDPEDYADAVKQEYFAVGKTEVNPMLVVNKLATELFGHTLCECCGDCEHIFNLKMILAFHSKRFQTDLLNYAFYYFLVRLKNFASNSAEALDLFSHSANIFHFESVKYCQRYEGFGLFVPVWHRGKRTNSFSVLPELVSALEALKKSTLEFRGEKQETLQDLTTLGLEGSHSHTPLTEVVENLKWVAESLTSWCNFCKKKLDIAITAIATGISLRRRKVPRLVVNLILKAVIEK